MTTLEEAWRWYEAVRRQTKLTRRLAEKHWDVLPWDGALGRDMHVRELDPTAIAMDAAIISDEMAGLAVVLFFSVCEAAVRESILAAMEPEVERLQHPAIRFAALEARDRIEKGSFSRILEPFKFEGYADLIEEVNQVRDYRNWVAHGRRGLPRANVTPEAAHDRLSRFLAVLKSLSS